MSKRSSKEAKKSSKKTKTISKIDCVLLKTDGTTIQTQIASDTNKLQSESDSILGGDSNLIASWDAPLNVKAFCLVDQSNKSLSKNSHVLPSPFNMQKYRGDYLMIKFDLDDDSIIENFSVSDYEKFKVDCPIVESIISEDELKSAISILLGRELSSEDLIFFEKVMESLKSVLYPDPDDEAENEEEEEEEDLSKDLLARVKKDLRRELTEEEGRVVGEVASLMKSKLESSEEGEDLNEEEMLSSFLETLTSKFKAENDRDPSEKEVEELKAQALELLGELQESLPVDDEEFDEEEENDEDEESEEGDESEDEEGN